MPTAAVLSLITAEAVATRRAFLTRTRTRTTRTLIRTRARTRTRTRTLTLTRQPRGRATHRPLLALVTPRGDGRGALLTAEATFARTPLTAPRAAGDC